MNPFVRFVAAAVITYFGVKQTVDQVRRVMDVQPPKKKDDWSRYLPR